MAFWTEFLYEIRWISISNSYKRSKYYQMSKLSAANAGFIDYFLINQPSTYYKKISYINWKLEIIS